MENSKPIATPMATNVKLTLEGEGELFDNTKYRGMIVSLLYLTTSRPDIMFSVCLCARFHENPKTSHVEAVKRIFRYLKGTIHLGLWYPKFTGVDIMCFADSDHRGSMIDRICAFLGLCLTSWFSKKQGLCLTSWFSKKQTFAALSTTEGEYVAVGRACAQVLWMKQTFLDYGIISSEIPICCDNKSVIDLSKN
ncbi:secreted RxLR effector protein 161-like [Rutidosis leptorrhynchoides]|uniref:secreted RxLR effector protein 161-like n=1 Tax=Rutidosis leptorrhynchoides TaxID=125765 RepID=UPI003A99305B